MDYLNVPKPELWRSGWSKSSLIASCFLEEEQGFIGREITQRVSHKSVMSNCLVGICSFVYKDFIESLWMNSTQIKRLHIIAIKTICDMTLIIRAYIFLNFISWIYRFFYPNLHIIIFSLVIPIYTNFFRFSTMTNNLPFIVLLRFIVWLPKICKGLYLVM